MLSCMTLEPPFLFFHFFHSKTADPKCKKCVCMVKISAKILAEFIYAPSICSHPSETFLGVAPHANAATEKFEKKLDLSSLSKNSETENFWPKITGNHPKSTKIQRSRPHKIKLHPHPTEQTHAIWVSNPSSAQ